MGQLTQIVLNDGKADLTFKPAGIDQNGVARLVNGNGVLVADKSLTISARKTSQRRKTVTKFDLPTIADETVNGISQPKQVRQAYIRVDTDFSVFATTAERSQAVALITAALKNALITDVIVNNDSIY